MQRFWLTLFAFVPTLFLLTHANAATLAPASLPENLKDTQWQLVDFQSMDDAIGTLVPPPNQTYQMHLQADGKVALQLDCNRAAGAWYAKPSSDANSGQFKFTPLAMTKASCAKPSMDVRIAQDAKFIRGYLLKGNDLYLNLLADGGIYHWTSLHNTQKQTIKSVAPELGGPRNWQVTTRLNLRSAPSTNATIIEIYPTNTLLDNLGCKTQEDRVWCDVQKLGGGARGYVAREFLQAAKATDGTIPTGEDNSALRAGLKDFDASGELPCSTVLGQPTQSCKFQVARAGGGYATLVIEKPNQYKRTIYFRLGKAIGSSGSQADGYPEFSATKQGDLHLIQVGDERYEIPDAVIFGG